MSDLLLETLHCRNQERAPPVWLMRQAGRHLASYRILREKYSFLEMCHEPDLIAKVTRLPIEAYGMDGAILFADILLVSEAMGVGLRFEDKVGPLIDRPILNRTDIEKLPSPDMSRLNYVAEGIRQLRKDLKVPLIGFCGAPFTVASYMIEGKSSRDLKKTKQWMLNDPEGFHTLLQKIVDWSIAYLKLQVDAGVQAIQVFDSWANALSHHAFREFSLAYLQRLVNEIQTNHIPVILFCRGSSVFAPQLAELKPAAIGLDWNCHMPYIRRQVGPAIALQGNLDPDILYAPLHRIESEVERILNEMSQDQGFIFNLGHGISPDVSEDAVRTLVNCVKKRRKS